jgi:ATP-dependent DNA ligase
MLGRLARELPRDGYLYEPKWDGFRSIAFRDGDELELQSRHGNPLGRYFPELVEGLVALAARRFVLDGEIVAVDSDFQALMARLHPAASRVERLREETPAAFVAFDLLAEGARPLLETPFVERRARLEALLADARPPILLTTVTDDASVARAWLERFEGVVAKARDLPYEPGKRTLVKVKRERTADCVVAGFRWRVDRPLPSSLLLGLYDDGGELQHVGVAASFGAARAESLLEELRPLIAPLEGHPWEEGFLVSGGPVGRLRGAAGRWTPEMTMDWTPVGPSRVVEVSYDQVDSDRFRHPARFVRWRPDRDPRSCTFEQLEPARPALRELLARA